MWELRKVMKLIIIVERKLVYDIVKDFKLHTYGSRKGKDKEKEKAQRKVNRHLGLSHAISLSISPVLHSALLCRLHFAISVHK